MNRLARLGAGLVFGVCCFLQAGQAWALQKCSAPRFSETGQPPKAVRRALGNVREPTLEQVEQKLRQVLDEQPAHHRVWFYNALGSLYLQQKRYADAEQAYRSALALEPTAGLRHVMQIKLASALFLSQKDDELIGLIEAIEKNECAPVSDTARYWLATAYAAKGRLADAERVVPKGEKVYAPEYRMLYWKIECALGRVDECAGMLATQVGLIEPSPEKAEWCARLVASLERAPEAAAGLQEARAKGAVDAENRCVLGVTASSTSYDQLIPVERTQPRYPGGALRRGLSGGVVAELTINPDGSVSSVKILGSSPPGVFDEAATTALKKWRFKPKVVDGVPVDSKGIQQVHFRIER